MGTQPRLPGTLAPRAVLAKNHRLAVNKERQAQAMVDNLAAAIREAKAALKVAVAERRSAEDDLAAEAEGRREG